MAQLRIHTTGMRLSTTMMPSTTPDSSRFSPLAKVPLDIAEKPPPMLIRPTLIRVRPIISTTMPVTSGVIQPLDERQYARDAHLDEGAGDDRRRSPPHHAFHRRALLDHQRPAGDQRADEVEAGALDDQQSGAERAEALALDEGGDAGDHQRHRHDQIGVARRYAQRLADQQAGGNDRHDDRQQVLEGGEQGDGSAGTVVRP